MIKKLLLALVAIPVLLIGLGTAYMAWDSAADAARSKAEHEARIESLTTALADADEKWATDKQAAMDQYVALLNEEDCAEILGTELTRAYSRTVAFAVDTGDKATARRLASAAYRLEFALSVDSESAKVFLNDFDRENISLADVSEALANADEHWELGQLDRAGLFYLTTATKESQLQRMLRMDEGVFYPLTRRQRNELEAFVAQLATALPRTYSRAIQYAVSQNDAATVERLAFTVFDRQLTLSSEVSDVTSILETARPKWNALRRERGIVVWTVNEIQRADSLWKSGDTEEAGQIYLALINVKEDNDYIIDLVEGELPAAWARVYSRAVDYSADAGDEATAIQIIERVKRNLWYTLSLTSQKAQQLAITGTAVSVASSDNNASTNQTAFLADNTSNADQVKWKSYAEIEDVVKQLSLDSRSQLLNKYGVSELDDVPSTARSAAQDAMEEDVTKVFAQTSIPVTEVDASASQLITDVKITAPTFRGSFLGSYLRFRVSFKARHDMSVYDGALQVKAYDSDDAVFDDDSVDLESDVAAGERASGEFTVNDFFRIRRFKILASKPLNEESTQPKSVPAKPQATVASGRTFQVAHVNGDAQLEVVVSDTVAEEVTFTSFEWTKRGIQFKGEIKSSGKWKSSVYRGDSETPRRRTLDYEKESIFSDKINGRILVIGNDATRVVIHH